MNLDDDWSYRISPNFERIIGASVIPARRLSIRRDVKRDDSRSANLRLTKRNIFDVHPRTEYSRRHEFFHFRSSFYASARANAAGTASYFAECNAIWRQKSLPSPSKVQRSNIFQDDTESRIGKKNDAHHQGRGNGQKLIHPVLVRCLSFS